MASTHVVLVAGDPGSVGALERVSSWTFPQGVASQSWAPCVVAEYHMLSQKVQEILHSVHGGMLAEEIYVTTSG